MRLPFLLAGCLGLISNTLSSQTDSAANANNMGMTSRAWIVPAAIGVSVAFDEEAREGALASHSRTLDHFARLVNPFGTARRLVPAMTISLLGAAVAGNHALERGTFNTIAGYVASDMVESALKPIIGRERPHVSGNSRRFHAFTRSGDWHATSISAVGDLLISLVGWDRVYEDQHWTSDVTATVAIASVVSRATVRWLETRWPTADTPQK
jgi:hypothetical protein